MLAYENNIEVKVDDTLNSRSNCVKYYNNDTRTISVTTILTNKEYDINALPDLKNKPVLLRLLIL